jgi:hypothetical protein
LNINDSCSGLQKVSTVSVYRKRIHVKSQLPIESINLENILHTESSQVLPEKSVDTDCISECHGSKDKLSEMSLGSKCLAEVMAGSKNVEIMFKAPRRGQGSHMYP